MSCATAAFRPTGSSLSIGLPARASFPEREYAGGMRVLAAALFGITAAAALLGQADAPQGRAPRGRADAGSPRQGPVLLGTDPPGKLKASPPSDAGVTAQADAGVDAVRAEVQQLRPRVDALERERA